MHRSLIAVLALTLSAAASARDMREYLMPADEERRMAATAAPPTVTESASYYRLTREGFELDRAGDNGWHCFVERAFFVQAADEPGRYDPRIRAPHCINTAGAESRMQELFYTAELAMRGRSREETTALVDAAYARGRLRPPEGLAMTYMMSPEQWLGDAAGHWHPHLMFWVPYLDNEQVGGNVPFGLLPFVGSDAGTRSAVLIVAIAPLDASSR